MEEEDIFREEDVEFGDEGDESPEENESGEEEMDDEEDSQSEGEDDEKSEDSDEEKESAVIEKEKQSDEEYRKKLDELEKQIGENKYQYQSYVDIIKLSREQADLNKLREYRLKMCEIFPLTESLWLEWLKDEQKLVDTNEERLKVDQLFRKSIQDYLSVEIWLEYIQFSIGGMGEVDGLEKTRKICEEAISFAGLHVTKGYLLWEAYREFETAIFSGLEQSFSKIIQTPEQTKQINEQLSRIENIFKRQIATCLDNTESTFKEIEEFDEKLVDASLKKVYEKTVSEYKEIEPFEIALIHSGSDMVKKLGEYKKYLDYESDKVKHMEEQVLSQIKGKQQQNLNELEEDLHKRRERLKCLFERSVADDSNCLDVSLWLKYVQYLNDEENSQIDLTSEMKEFYVNVAKRAVRNCYWSSRLWINYALLLEKHQHSHETIKSVFNDAMNAGLQTSHDYLQIWHFYLDFLKRQFLSSSQESRESQIEEIRDSFQKAINQIFEFFKHNGDPTFSLEKYWAYVEAKYFKNIEQARKIFNEMILAKSASAKYSPVWLEFFEIEREFGDEKHQRRLLNRALNECVHNDDKEIIHDVLFKFEKQNGNIQQFSSIYSKYEKFKEEKMARLEEAKKNLNNKKEPKKQEFSKIEKKVQPIKKKPEKSEKSNKLKRKNEDAETAETSQAKKPATALKDKDGFAIPALPPSLPTPQQTTTSTNNKTTPAKLNLAAREPEKPRKTLDEIKKDSNLTVFISNLSYEADEEKIREVFQKSPGFQGIRLIKHWSGKSKGYGYVDFDTHENAVAALKLDRSPIEGRPVFVSPNEDKSLNFGIDKFKYQKSIEKNKLFVTGLPFTTTKEELEDMFKAFGKVKEVRIVTYRSGKSKGLAYVDFEDEQSASKALIQTDNMLIGEHQITVAISNPPKRKKPDEFTDNQPPSTNRLSSSLGAGSATSSFIPRSQLVGRKKILDIKK